MNKRITELRKVTTERGNVISLVNTAGETLRKVYVRNGRNCADINGTYSYLPDDLSKVETVTINGEMYIKTHSYYNERYEINGFVITDLSDNYLIWKNGKVVKRTESLEKAVTFTEGGV